MVVGVGDGLLRTRVLDRAVAEARRRDRTVRVVHADAPTGSEAPSYGDAGERAESYLSRTAPDVEVRRTCGTGDPASAMAAACGASSLLVVGDRHRRLGSEAGRTTEELIAIAPCPVLVLGEDRAPSAVPVPRRAVVVVGLDEGAGAAIVLDHALRIAEMSAEPVEVVHAVDEVTYDVGRIARRRDADVDDEETDARARIEGLVSARKDRFPDVPTSVVVADDRPARLLLERALGADLVVVAHRGHDAEDLVGLGSTTRSLLLAAPCPVLVLGPTGRRRGRRSPHPGGRRAMSDPLGAAARGDRADADGLAVAVRETHTAVLWFVGDRVHKMKKPVDLGFCDFTHPWSGAPGLRAGGRAQPAPQPRRLPRASRRSHEPAGRVRGVPGRRCAVCRRTAASRRWCGRARPSTCTCGPSPGCSPHSTSVAAPGPEIDARARGEALAGAVGGDPRRSASPRGRRARRPTASSRSTAEAPRSSPAAAPVRRRGEPTDRVVDGHGDLLADDVFCLDDGPRPVTVSSSTTGCASSTASTTPPSSPWTSSSSARPEPADRFLELLRGVLRRPGTVLPSSPLRRLPRGGPAPRSPACASRQGDASRGGGRTRLLDLAWRPPPRRAAVRLVLVGGLPGTGQVHPRRRRSPTASAPSLLSSDRLRKEMAGLSPTDPAAAGYREGLYRPERTDATYAALLHRAGELLGRGESVVLDASWTDAGRREAAALAARTSSDWSRCAARSPGTWPTRASAPAGSASDATPLWPR